MVTRLSPPERWAAALAGVTARLVVAGHTHQQDDRTVGGVRFVNAGSVGLPYEGDGAARWLWVADGEPELRRHGVRRRRRGAAHAGRRLARRALDRRGADRAGRPARDHAVLRGPQRTALAWRYRDRRGQLGRWGPTVRGGGRAPSERPRPRRRGVRAPSGQAMFDTSVHLVSTGIALRVSHVPDRSVLSAIEQDVRAALQHRPSERRRTRSVPVHLGGTRRASWSGSTSSTEYG